MMNQVLSSIELILACFLVYQAVIRSGVPGHPDDHNVRERTFEGPCGTASTAASERIQAKPERPTKSASRRVQNASGPLNDIGVRGGGVGVCRGSDRPDVTPDQGAMGEEREESLRDVGCRREGQWGLAGVGGEGGGEFGSGSGIGGGVGQDLELSGRDGRGAGLRQAGNGKRSGASWC